MDEWDSVSSDKQPNNNDWDSVSTLNLTPVIARKQQTHYSQPKPREARPPVKRRRLTGPYIAIIVLSVAVIGLSAFSALGIFHVVNFNRGSLSISPISPTVPQKEGLTSGQAEATSIVADANASATALTTLEMAAINPTATAIAGFPEILSVSQILPVQNQEITISGKGFGTLAPYTNSISPYLRIEDITGNWVAGWTGDLVTDNVSAWNDNKIVVTGFAGSYGANGYYILHTGDIIYVSVWNPQTGKGGTATALTSVIVGG